MRVKLNKSWNSISVAMGKMFHFPQNRFRHMIENAVTQLGKLDLTSELVPAFLKETIDLSSVGPWCDALRITRRQLLDWTLIENDSLCAASLQNGLLLELDRFRSVEKLQPGHLVDWVKGLGNMDVAPLERELVSTLKQIKTEYQALNKSKTMNREKIEMFLKEQFTISVAVPTPVAAEGVSQCTSTADSNTLADDHVHAMPDLQEQVDSDDQNALKHSQILGMTNKKLTGDLALRDAEIAALKEKLAVVQDMSKSFQCDKLSLERQVTKAKRELDTSEATRTNVCAKVKKLTGDLVEKTRELDECKTQLKDVKGAGLYQRNKRKEDSLKKKEISIKSKSVQDAAILQLRRQIRGLQTQRASLKLTASAHRSEEISLRKAVKALKEQCAVFEATLSSVDGEKLPTRDGFQFLESVEKTTMQLMGSGRD